MAEPSWPSFVANGVLPFLRNGHMRPVVIAILGHFAVALALPILAFARSGRPEDGAVLFLFVAVTAFPALAEWSIERRPGTFTACVAGAWVGAAAISAWGWQTGVI